MRLLFSKHQLLLLLLLPVRQSVLAPAEVVPLDGQVVAAPLDGVIAEFLVKPNQSVQQGDVLVRFDATSIKAQADVAERSLQVAEAELRANAQRAFSDAESGARIDLFTTRVAQKRAERDYARQLLARTEGVLLDPVYTGKAFAGLLDGIARQAFAGNGPLLFLHTGGSPALFAYHSATAI